MKNPTKEIIEEAKAMVERTKAALKINAKDRRRMVELHNLICEGTITFTNGCVTCGQKSFARLRDYLENNGIKPKKAPKASKPVQVEEISAAPKEEETAQESPSEEESSEGNDEETQDEQPEVPKEKRKRRTQAQIEADRKK